MKHSTYTKLMSDYRCGEYVSTAALIKAGVLVETEATKMLTAQLHDANLTLTEKVAARKRIERAGYRIEMTGNMKHSRVFEERAA